MLKIGWIFSENSLENRGNKYIVIGNYYIFPTIAYLPSSHPAMPPFASVGVNCGRVTVEKTREIGISGNTRVCKCVGKGNETPGGRMVCVEGPGWMWWKCEYASMRLLVQRAALRRSEAHLDRMLLRFMIILRG